VSEMFGAALGVVRSRVINADKVAGNWDGAGVVAWSGVAVVADWTRGGGKAFAGAAVVEAPPAGPVKRRSSTAPPRPRTATQTTNATMTFRGNLSGPAAKAAARSTVDGISVATGFGTDSKSRLLSGAGTMLGLPLLGCLHVGPGPRT
jgi:hypothetical protein